jgi:hypothetical protein
LTDRSKSQRKRRLQLNAEDFAPPTDMHQAPDEPNLDEAWVKYYGGEKQGGLKRLTSLDDDSTAESNNSGIVAPPDAGTHPVTEDVPKAQRHTSLPPTQGPEIHSVEHQQAPPEKPLPRTITPIKEFRRQEQSRPAEPVLAPGLVRSEAGQATSKPQIGNSKGLDAPNQPVAPLPTTAEADSTAPSFESWSKRWTPWLKRGGSIKVCEAFYLLTHAKGQAECFTSNSEIMKRTNLSRAQCIRNIHYLIEMGFLDELSEINNKEAKGTYYRFNLVPKSLDGQLHFDRINKNVI